jgi:SAM-dependent methyltransferase
MRASFRKTARKIVDLTHAHGLVFRLQETWRAWRSEPTSPGAEDGLAIPGARLIVSIGAHGNAAAYLQGGRFVFEGIKEILRAHGVKIEDFKSILDFGCGCGRILRYWRELPASVAIYGVDYNKSAVGWCSKNLPFVRVTRNELGPPLAFEASSFDFIYAFSVFTHLSTPLQTPWMRELSRVLAPGGYLLITVHGESFREMMTPDEQVAFDKGELVVRHSGMAGSNLCAAFHPARYIEVLSQGLDLVAHLPARLGQDAVLFRKPIASLAS